VKQPRRWAIVLTALLMAASLVLAPRRGSAGPAGPELILGDPRPTVELGVPEIPPNARPRVTCRIWLSSVLLAKGLQVDFIIAVETPNCRSGARFVRFAPRTAARP
jgi:hypothetical protein